MEGVEKDKNSNATNGNNNGIIPFKDNIIVTKITSQHLAKISVIVTFYHIKSLSISIIAILGATALYALISTPRREILYSVGYSVLIFFAAIFIFTYG